MFMDLGEVAIGGHDGRAVCDRNRGYHQVVADTLMFLLGIWVPEPFQRGCGHHCREDVLGIASQSQIDKVGLFYVFDHFSDPSDCSGISGHEQSALYLDEDRETYA